MALTELAEKGADVDLLREMIQFVAQRLMDMDVETLCGAGYGERTAERVNHRNGYRPRLWDTRAGSVDLEIPRLRKGSYFPGFLQPRRTAEKALVAVIQEAYIQGVSTRSMDELVKSFGMTGISKSQVSRLCEQIDERVQAFLNRPIEGEWPYLWLDATYIKTRQAGRIVSVAATLAVAVNAEGVREILGLRIGPSEAEPFWTDFLRSLSARGLGGVKLVIAESDVLAFMAFPKAHRTKIHSTNPLERLNAEIKRRTKVVGIFPNEAAIVRLVGALLLEQNDE